MYADRLENYFAYTNTFYHREPRFDLSRPDEIEFGKYDFVIWSDVLEHVPEPLERAFRSLSSLLKPTGVLILTVPYSLEPELIEHYPDLAEFGFAEIAGPPARFGRLANGEYRVFDRLNFHRGKGSTLERRILSDQSLRLSLAAAGFSNVRFDATGNREFGVVFSDPCSLPICAQRGSFALNASGVTELVNQLSAAREELRTAREQNVCRTRAALRSNSMLSMASIGQSVGLGPDVPRALPR